MQEFNIAPCDSPRCDSRGIALGGVRVSFRRFFELLYFTRGALVSSRVVRILPYISLRQTVHNGPPACVCLGSRLAVLRPDRHERRRGRLFLDHYQHGNDEPVKLS